MLKNCAIAVFFVRFSAQETIPCTMYTVELYTQMTSIQ